MQLEAAIVGEAVVSPRQVDLAAAAAKAAFDSYRARSDEERSVFLERVATEIEALGDQLLQCAHEESGLPLARLTGERARTTGQLRQFADLLRDRGWRRSRVVPAMTDRQPLPRPDLRMRMVPIGPVAVFGASNFPLAFSTAGGDTAAALAAGCPVVVRCHPAHPRTGALVAEAIEAAVRACDMPQGTFGHVAGESHDIGAALVRDPRIAAVGFTGSRAGGLALVKIAQERPVPIPVFAEMSSVNPVVILSGALRSRGAALGAAFVQSLTLGAGQFCTNPGLVLLVGSDGADAFVDAASSALAWHQPEPMLTGSIRAGFATGAAALASHANVRTVATGCVGDGVASEAARLFETDAEALLADPVLQHEVFGASSLVVRCRDIDQLNDVLEGLEGQLTATLHLDDADHDEARGLMPILERKAGRILVNGWPTGVEVSPAMVHGGPFPATSDGRSTSVGTLAIERFLRPVCYQDMPDALLPRDLRGAAGDE